MKILLFLVIIIGLIILYQYFKIYYKRYVLKQKLYKSETLLSSGGIASSEDWFDNDEEALKKVGFRDFVYRIYPDKKQLKPKK